MRAWMLKAFFFAIFLLSLIGWVDSYANAVTCGRIGAYGFGLQSMEGEIGIWVYKNHDILFLRSPQWFLWRSQIEEFSSPQDLFAPHRTKLLGLSVGDIPGHYNAQYVGIRFWLLTLLTGTAFLFIWRKDKRTKRGGFPIDPNPHPPT